MTIKQYGGVFGRNPTFNDVTIEGELTFDGDIDIGSDLKINGDLEVLGLSTFNSGADNKIADFISTDAGAFVYIQDSNALGYYHGASNGSYVIRDTDNNTRLSIDSSGNISVGAGNLVIGTSGKGIDFSATAGTGTSELLDDYEEGEFAVTLTPSTSGSIALQAGADTMLYNKVGRVVHCQGQINVSSIASAVGSSIAVNLPFAKLNTTDGSEASSGPVTYYNTSAYSVLPAYVPGSATQAFNIVIDPSTLANAHAFYIQFSYTAA